MSAANKSTQAYEVLEQFIIFQDLPPGSLYSEQEIVNVSGFGRTPVREALQRLVGDRLVEISRRGVYIPEMTVDSQLNLLELRRPLEETTARLAARRRTSVQKEAASQMVSRLFDFSGGDVREFEAMLRSVHSLLVDCAHNQYLAGTMGPLQALSRRFWFAHLHEPDAEVRRAAELHSDILRAVADGLEGESALAAHRLHDYLSAFAVDTLSRR